MQLGHSRQSDRVDACVIALYAKTVQPKATPADAPSQIELRELSRLRHSLECQCQANQQRLSDGPASAIVRSTLKKTIVALRREIRRVECALEELVRKDQVLSKDFERAMTVKGIGPKTASIILAEFGDLRRYNRDEVIALAGLYPREFTSGTSVHKKSRLAKGGRTPVRAALYMCAMSAIQANHQIDHFAKRLEHNNKEPMEIIGAVMRKLLLVVHAVVVTETHYDPQYQEKVKSKAA